MKPRIFTRGAPWLAVAAFLFGAALSAADTALADGRYLFAATPGIRDYLEFGGHGVLVFDIDHGHRFVKRIASSGVDETGSRST